MTPAHSLSLPDSEENRKRTKDGLIPFLTLLVPVSFIHPHPLGIGWGGRGRLRWKGTVSPAWEGTEWHLLRVSLRCSFPLSLTEPDVDTW